MKILQRMLARRGAVDLYEINAFYIRLVEFRPAWDELTVWVRLSYQKPYRGSEPGPEYDTWEKVAYAGKALFTLEEAEKIRKLLDERHSSAHADL